MFGRENVMPVDIVYGIPPRHEPSEQTSYARELRETLENAYELVRQNLNSSAKRRKRGYDMGVRINKFSVGDKVWVFIPRKRRNHYPKWERFYQGPFKITEQTGPLNFKVEKLPRGRTFVVHVDKLVLCRPSPEQDKCLCGDNVRDAASKFKEYRKFTEIRHKDLIDDDALEMECYGRESEEKMKGDIPRLRPRERLRRPLRYEH